MLPTSPRRAPRRRSHALPAVLAFLALLVAPLAATTSPAQAVNGWEFDAGYIISDENFFAGQSMSVGDIQAFLDGKVSSCRATDPGLPCLRYLMTSTSNRAATAYCQAYTTSGWESAATILAKVGQACNISPKVLLVMLQKEQGLVTSTKPTAYAYERAMGYACPDGSPCNAQYFGFFNQVYAAASRFQQYTARPQSYNYRIGQNQILFHPDRIRCGSGAVTIRNQATANLYIYTPYQPNAAALANLNGTGDACSSYGNRNFWRFYNDWFGSPTAPGAGVLAIDAEAAARRSILGNPTSSYLGGGEYGSGLARAFEGGSVYWTSATGARSVYGVVRSAFFSSGALSGPLGYPSSDLLTMPQRAGGLAQAFVGGSIYVTDATGPLLVTGAVRTAYFATGGATGPAGWPTSAPQAVSGGTIQRFESGQFMASSAGAFHVPAAIVPGYGAPGTYVADLGWPTSSASAIGTGSGQAFSGGSVYTSSAGSFAVRAPILAPYFRAKGAAGSLGFPIGVASCSDGTCRQSFAGGDLEVAPDGSSRIVNAGIEEVAKREADLLGAATSDLVAIAQNGGGYGKAYQRGSVYSSAAGAFSVREPVRSAYFANNGASGRLGFPTAAMVCRDGACSQRFQGGSVHVAANGTVQTTSAVIDAVAEQEAARLGERTSGVITLPYGSGGTAQAYRQGSVYSSSAGTFAVLAPFLSPYFAAGGAAGPLGYPASKELAMSGGSGQAFTGGSVYSSSAGTFAVLPPFLAPYFGQGGATGPLGYPTSGTLTLPGGRGQAFSGGSIYSSSAGTFAVRAPLLKQYFAQGGATGPLGYPVSAMSCAGGTCTQRFAGGTLSAAG